MGDVSLRTVLECVVAHPETVRVHAGRARERVRAHCSWESAADAYERLFRELLDEAR